MSEQDLTILISVIVTVLVIGGLITLIVLLSIRQSKYKHFVLENSQSIHQLDNLNRKFIFKTYNDRLNYHFRFDNKGHWRNTETVAFLTKKIRDNLPNWLEVKDRIEFNRNLLKEYLIEVDKAKASISEDLCKTAGMKYSKCLKMENKIFKFKIQKPSTDIVVEVILRYVSPKGKVNVTKESVFRYKEIARIIDSVSLRRVDSETYKRLASAERAIITDSMRYDVLKRDNFRCVLCGMSSKDGAILHVDHIVPVSKGGKSVMSNLRTLCERCNLGKSNKIE